MAKTEPIELDPNIHPWECQTGENSRWYGRFLAYRDMGPSRSILGAYKRELAENSRKEQDKASVPNSWDNASKQFRWAERADAWDRSERDRQRQNELAIEQEALREWRDRQMKLREDQWEWRNLLLEKAKEMLEQSLFVMHNKQMEDGSTAAVAMPAKWSFRDASTFIQLANELSKSATDAELEELDAIATLVRAGWLPKELLHVAGDRFYEMKAAVFAAFSSLELSEPDA